jgi:hypothetical protein
MSNRSEKRLEKYELPSTIDGICSLLRHLLEMGHVGRIEMDNDDAYIRVWRWVERNDLSEPDINWDGALRNLGSFMEYSSAGAGSFQVLVDMMLLAYSEGLKSVVWATGSGGSALLKEWLNLKARGMPTGDISYLLGLPILELKSLPKETLILCCSKFPNADPAEISLAIKTTIDVRGTNVQDLGDDDRVGDHSQEHAGTVGPLALSARALRPVPWKADREVGH